MNQVLLVVIDGLSDRPIRKLANLTPLEAAKKPNLNTLAKRGIQGLMHTISPGVRPGSDVAHLSLLSYNPYKYYPGRGPFEAAGLGMDFKVGDLAFRGNFATVSRNLTILNRRAGRIDKTEELVKLLNGIKIDTYQFFLKKGVGHRVAVILRGKNLNEKVTDTDPHFEGKKVLTTRPKISDQNAKKTAKVINQFTKKCYEILDGAPLNKKRRMTGLPPANIILLRGAGKFTKIPSFKEKTGFSSAMIAGGGLYKGIGKFLKMRVLEVKGATGTPETNLKEKVKKALWALSHFDFVFLHIKGTDSLAEDGNYLGKKKFIEKIDKAIKPLLSLKETLIVLTSDHSTSSSLRIHTADPVPLLIVGEEIRTDETVSFDERSASTGRLGHIRGEELMPIIKDQLGRAPLMGA